MEINLTFVLTTSVTLEVQVDLSRLSQMSLSSLTLWKDALWGIYTAKGTGNTQIHGTENSSALTIYFFLQHYWFLNRCPILISHKRVDFQYASKFAMRPQLSRGITCHDLGPLQHWSHGLESCSRHKCMSRFSALYYLVSANPIPKILWNV
jgi:hypothetical protein